MAAEEERLKLGVASHHESADPLGAVKFVGTDGQRGDAELAEYFPEWSVPAFMDTELGCQLTELPIP